MTQEEYISARHRGYKTFFYKTIVGNLTFISMINTTPKRLKARN